MRSSCHQVMNRWLTCTKIDIVNLFKTNYGWFIIINFGEANILMKLWHKIKQAKVILSGRCIYYSSLTFVFHLMTISISLCNQCLLINIVSVNPAQTLCDKVCQWLATGHWFSPGTPVPPAIKVTTIQLKYCWKWR
jgi:hypothetical protein